MGPSQLFVASLFAAVFTAVVGFGLMASAASVVRKRSSKSLQEAPVGLGLSAFVLIGVAVAATDFLREILLNPYSISPRSYLIGHAAQTAVAELLGVTIFGPLGGKLFRKGGMIVVGQVGGSLVGASISYYALLALRHLGDILQDILSAFQQGRKG